MFPQSTPHKEFTTQELSKCDGSRGNPVCVAYRGLIYDLSGSAHWYTGVHRELHFAGQDLTGEIMDAPHSDLVFYKFPVIGTLKL